MTQANTTLHMEDDGFPLGQAALDRLRLDIIQMRERMQTKCETTYGTANVVCLYAAPAGPPLDSPIGQQTDAALLTLNDRAKAPTETDRDWGTEQDLGSAQGPDSVSITPLHREAPPLIDHLRAPTATDPQDSQDLAPRIEAGFQMMHDRLRLLVAEINGRAPATEAGPLADQIGLLVRRLDEGATAETGRLQSLVDVIEHHLVVLTERMVESQQHLARLGSIEDALARLDDQMSHLSQASAEISREALQAVALKLSARDDAPALIGLKRSLAALEARQRNFEQRTEELMVRELELNLKDLVDLERARTVGGAKTTVMPPEPTLKSFNLDRHLFEMALEGEVHDTSGRPALPAFLGWIAAKRSKRNAADTTSRARSWLLARIALIVGGVTAGGLMAAQLVRAGAPAPDADKSDLAMAGSREG